MLQGRKILLGLCMVYLSYPKVMGQSLSVFSYRHPRRKLLFARPLAGFTGLEADGLAGTVGSINLFGGPECGFIAAIGHFLFDFTLFIEDEGGLPIPISVGEKTQAQIRITYGNHQMDPEDIAVNVVYDLSRTEEPRPPHHYANDLVARVSWQNCLTQAFTGTSLSTLMSQPQQVADYIGSYARILEALAHPEESGNLFRALLVHLPGRDSINDSDIRPQVYGEKFLQSMWTTLPELGFSPEVQSRAVKASSNQSLDPVIKTLLSTVRGWEQLCGCDSCRKQRQYREYIEYDYNFCIISIMRMACRLITDLAGVIREPKLDPTLEGLVNCYKAVHQTGNEPILDRPEGILPHVQSAATVDSFGIVSILFTGRERKFDQLYKQWGPTFESKMSAISHHGICMNIHALESLSSSAEEIGRLYVRPGRIEWRGKGYDVVWDGDYDESKLSDEICLAKNKAFLEIVNPANAMSYDTPRPDGFTISGHVIDDNEVGDLSDVQLVYKIQWPGGESDFLGPSMLTRMILRYSGGIACGHGPDLGVMMDHSHLRSQLHLIQSGWSLHWPDSLPKGVVLWPPQSEIGRCIALLMSYCHQESNRGSEVYIRSGECLACIVGAVDRLNVRRMPEPTTIIV